MARDPLSTITVVSIYSVLVLATISLLDVPTTFWITVAILLRSPGTAILEVLQEVSLTAPNLRKGSAAGGMLISPNAARRTRSSV